MTYLIVSGVAWFLAQFIKVGITRVQEKRWDFSLMFSSGGMPSSHSAFVTSLATQIGMLDHFDSPLFALACVFAFITMFDAMNVRQSVGIQARELNMLRRLVYGNQGENIDPIKEILGHSPFQVAAGFLLGIIIGWLGFSYFV